MEFIHKYQRIAISQRCHRFTAKETPAPQLPPSLPPQYPTSSPAPHTLQTSKNIQRPQFTPQIHRTPNTQIFQSTPPRNPAPPPQPAPADSQYGCAGLREASRNSHDHRGEPNTTWRGTRGETIPVDSLGRQAGGSGKNRDGRGVFALLSCA